MSASIVSILHFSHLKILLGRKLGSKCCRGVTLMLDVWFIALQQVTHLCNFCQMLVILLCQGGVGDLPSSHWAGTHSGHTAHPLWRRHNSPTHSHLGAICSLQSIWSSWRKVTVKQCITVVWYLHLYYRLTQNRVLSAWHIAEWRVTGCTSQKSQRTWLGK